MTGIPRHSRLVRQEPRKRLRHGACRMTFALLQTNSLRSVEALWDRGCAQRASPVQKRAIEDATTITGLRGGLDAAKKTNCGQPRLSAWGKPSKWQCAFLLASSWYGGGTAMTQSQTSPIGAASSLHSASRREPLQCRPVPGVRYSTASANSRASRERETCRCNLNY